MKKTIAFDLDDTLCYRPKNVEHLGKNKYEQCEPIQEMIDISNRLYDNGHTIIIYTARGMTIYNGDVNKIYSNLYEQTLSDLKKWGIKHHGLVMGKISFDYLVDDKGLDLNAAKLILKDL